MLNKCLLTVNVILYKLTDFASNLDVRHLQNSEYYLSMNTKQVGKVGPAPIHRVESHLHFYECLVARNSRDETRN